MKRRRSVLPDVALEAVHTSAALDESLRREAPDELRQRDALQRASAQHRERRRERLDGGLRWAPDPTGLLWFLRLVLHGVAIHERASAPEAKASHAVTVSGSGPSLVRRRPRRWTGSTSGPCAARSAEGAGRWIPSGPR